MIFSLHDHYFRLLQKFGVGGGRDSWKIICAYYICVCYATLHCRGGICACTSSVLKCIQCECMQQHHIPSSQLIFYWGPKLPYWNMGGGGFAPLPPSPLPLYSYTDVGRGYYVLLHVSCCIPTALDYFFLGTDIPIIPLLHQFFTAYSLQNEIALISLRRVKRRENEILAIFVYVTVAVDYLYRNTCCPCYESKQGYNQCSELLHFLKLMAPPLHIESTYSNVGNHVYTSNLYRDVKTFFIHLCAWFKDIETQHATCSSSYMFLLLLLKNLECMCLPVSLKQAALNHQ